MCTISLMARSTSASRWAKRLAILFLVKFLSFGRSLGLVAFAASLFTALNLLPSMATQSPFSKPIREQLCLAALHTFNETGLGCPPNVGKAYYIAGF